MHGRRLHRLLLRDLQLLQKRCFDVVAAALLLILFAPLLLIVALLVRLSSSGPILYRQDRCGLGGRIFVMLKFRTMVVNQAEIIDPEYASRLQASGVLLKMKDDPRVTRIGKFLRRTSMDELPQLVNVIRGDMSLVGPRPLIPFMLNLAEEYAEERRSVRPGITGMWQVEARSKNISLLQMIRFDLKYIREFSLWLDFRILLATIPVL